jgi:hypothetical protein
MVNRTRSLGVKRLGPKLTTSFYFETRPTIVLTYNYYINKQATQINISHLI